MNQLQNSSESTGTVSSLYTNTSQSVSPDKETLEKLVTQIRPQHMDIEKSVRINKQ